MSSQELLSLFDQSKEKIKKIEKEIESINIELSRTIQESSESFPPSPKYVDVISELQKKIHKLEIQIDEEREYRKQIALKLSRLKKQSLS